jgi:Flp pilus assembly protein CpaB
MRPRTFLLLILVLVVAAVAAVLIFVVRPNQQAQQETAGQETAAAEGQGQEPGQAAPTATPEPEFVPVVVSVVDLPVGERLRPGLVGVEMRPADNVAVLAGVTFDDPELVIGQLVKTSISSGQEILRPMLALNPSDVATMGSDLALYIDQGKVAIAFPIDRYSGAAYGMRPGDLVDAMMSLSLIDLDPEFGTPLPNIIQRVNESALLEGQAFLFPATAEGRLELIPLINTVAEIGPGGGRSPIPRKVTQLTLQQMEVLWMGTWSDPSLGLIQEYNAEAVDTTPPQPDENGQIPPQPTPQPQRPERAPDLVILSMSAQDALSLKWALETGIDINLALRAQGDNSVYSTAAVSLPQIFEQGVLVPPEPSEVGLQQRIDEVPRPAVPPSPPTNP